MSFIHSFYQKVKVIFQNERKQIWLVKNTYDGQLCVIKLQHNSTEAKKGGPRNVLHEGKFLQTLQGYSGIPFMYWAGRQEATNLAILIVQRLGKTLEELFREQGCRFSLKTVCQLGINLIKMIRVYHEKGFVLGNICLSNIQLGVGKKCGQLYFNDLIDSDLFVKKEKHVKQRQYHRKIKINQFLTVDRLSGFLGARRDDVESIIYVLVYMLKGSLPWTKYFQKPIFNITYDQEGEMSIGDEETKEATMKLNQSIQKNSKNAYNEAVSRLIERVQAVSEEDICSGIHPAFLKMLKCCKSSEFEQKPNYNYFIRTMEKILEEKGMSNDSIYDWMVGKDKGLAIKKEEYKNFGLKVSREDMVLYNWYYPYEKNVELS